MPGKRRPYVREIKACWWTRLPFYRFYMLREGTAVPAVWFSILLMYGLAALSSGPEAWACYVRFLAHPLTALINLIAFLAALLHTKTWFELTPSALPLPEEKKGKLIKGLWAATAVASLLVLLITLCA
ncbi:MAG: fumarate reductase subunit FrdC [Desulfovibrio sp.]|jgi:fumarate reductase subunit C|nr:fumarate reductase subunit FrdC [Desulfovibrio sp.]